MMWNEIPQNETSIHISLLGNVVEKTPSPSLVYKNYDCCCCSNLKKSIPTTDGLLNYKGKGDR